MLSVLLRARVVVAKKARRGVSCILMDGDCTSESIGLMKEEKIEDDDRVEECGMSNTNAIIN